MATEVDPAKRRCSLLIFLATPTEEEALGDESKERGFPFERIRDPKWSENFYWLGPIGNQPAVIAVGPSREGGKLVMGALGRLGSAAKGLRFLGATGAQAIIQLGMAFGIDPVNQKLGDVLISTSLVPYDNREVRPAAGGEAGYVVDYSQANRQPARRELVKLLLDEQRRGGRSFGVHAGTLLSGAARIFSRVFRDELVRGIPAGDDPIVGGEMEGVGLLAASTDSDNSVWCVVKGISDFADEDRDSVIGESRAIACRNAASFLLSALVNATSA